MEQFLKIIIYKKSLPVFVICGVDVSGGNKVAFDTLKEKKKINSYFTFIIFWGSILIRSWATCLDTDNLYNCKMTKK